jgi:hypothetical protein
MMSHVRLGSPRTDQGVFSFFDLLYWRSTLGLLVQEEQVQRLGRLRLAGQRLTQRPSPQEQAAGTTPLSKPGWLLLFFDICWLAGALLLTLYISWVYDHLPAGDPIEYHQYALAFWNHVPRFHAFPKEYPPLSLIPFSFTLFPYFQIHFYWSFAMWMGAITCLSYAWFARTLSRSKAIAYVIYLVVGATATLLMRFDLLPALVTLGALVLAERKRYTWAYVLLAIGVLLKLYPGFLVPVLLAYQWRELTRSQSSASERDAPGWHLGTLRERLAQLWETLTMSDIALWRAQARALWQRGRPVWIGLGAFTGVLILGFSVPALINWQGTISEFRYALVRPIQIESVPASLLWLGTFLGYPARPNVSFVSLNLVGPLDGPIRTLSLLALVVGTGLVCWRVGRGKLSLGQGFLAMIVVVLASNKLLSPQYIIWALPLVAYIEGFDLLWLAICALTTLIFPFLYQTQHPIINVPNNPGFLPVITLRNALLIVATVLAVRGRSGTPAQSAPAEAGTDEALAELAREETAMELSPTALAVKEFSQEERRRLVESTR